MAEHTVFDPFSTRCGTISRGGSDWLFKNNSVLFHNWRIYLTERGAKNNTDVPALLLTGSGGIYQLALLVVARSPAADLIG